MRKISTLLGGTALAVMLAVTAPVPATAQDNSYNPDHVLARVNGTEIKLETVVRAWRAMAAAQPGNRQPPAFEQVAGPILNRLIEQELAGKAALAAGLDKSEAYLADLEKAKERLLLKTWLESSLQAAMTPERLQEAYQRTIAALPNEEQIDASHILVKTEEEARAAKQEVDAGADFGEVAKRLSTGPSGPVGGKLGWIKRSDVVEPFGTAAFQLNDGQVSEPVKTQFGWHVIKGGPRRDAPKPTLQQMEGQLRQQLEQQLTQNLLDDLRKNATVELFDMDGKPVQQPQQ